MVLEEGSRRYEVNDPVARNPSSNFYICNDSNGQYFLQISATKEGNHKIDRAAYILNEMKSVSDLLEERFQIKYPGATLGYDLLFPIVKDSFISCSQGGKMINILAVRDIDRLIKMVPLSNIRKRDYRAIDLETSIWVMGRLLKLLILAHDQGISIKIDSDNVIIEAESHRVVVLDWTVSEMSQYDVPGHIRKRNISNVAKLTLSALGKGTNFFDRYKGNSYVDFIECLTIPKCDDTKSVYEEFELAHRQIIESGVFYPFKTYPIF